MAGKHSHSASIPREADLPEEIDTSERVVVPETICPLDEEALAMFRESLHFVQDEGLGNTQPYLHALRILDALANNDRL